VECVGLYWFVGGRARAPPGDHGREMSGEPRYGAGADGVFCGERGLFVEDELAGVRILVAAGGWCGSRLGPSLGGQAARRNLAPRCREAFGVGRAPGGCVPRGVVGRPPAGGRGVPAAAPRFEAVVA